jgi:hypothetical protein
MLNFLLNVLDRYGLDVFQIAIISYFGWKIMTNHLKHLKDQIENICRKLDNHETKLNGVTERIARIEGKLD